MCYYLTPHPHFDGLSAAPSLLGRGVQGYRSVLEHIFHYSTPSGSGKWAVFSVQTKCHALHKCVALEGMGRGRYAVGKVGRSVQEERR